MRRTVKRVIDGDTIQVSRKIGDTNIVRLAGVNAPEKGTPSGRRATNVLRGAIGGQTVTVKPVARDVYGRVVGNIIYDRRNINRRMRDKEY